MSNGPASEAMSTVSTLTFLLGTWDVARMIEDHKLGTCRSFVGTAVLREIPADCRVVRPQASYTELGVLRFGTHQGEARRLLELRQSNKSTVMFFFADGRPFTDLDLSAGTWESTHFCGKDCYEITTFVLSHDVLQERWKVRGPTKNYDAMTTLKRIDGGCVPGLV